jgi:hypothetical protein
MPPTDGCDFRPANAVGDTMSDKLKALIEKFRHYQMSEAELEDQIVNFAYGNAHYEDSRVTREDVERHSVLVSRREAEDQR